MNSFVIMVNDITNWLNVDIVSTIKLQRREAVFHQANYHGFKLLPRGYCASRDILWGIVTFIPITFTYQDLWQEDTTVTEQAFPAEPPVIFYLDILVTRDPAVFTSCNFTFHGLAQCWKKVHIYCHRLFLCLYWMTFYLPVIIFRDNPLNN